MQVIEVELDAVTTQATPPTVTIGNVGTRTNPVPVIVIDVPPAVGPLVGATDPIVGVEIGVTYVERPVPVPSPVSELVTTTFTSPAACTPVTAVIDVAETLTTLVAATPPIVTELTVGVKPVPVIVTGVPPAVVPDAGEMAVTVGVEIGVTYV